MSTESCRDRRAAQLEQLERELFDLVVIGGGINGASIARDAALRGYRVALLERADFGSGTSSRSSRLIHGGLRYLETAEIGLVFESVSERATLARLGRHIVRPLPFIFPVYRSDRWPLWILNIGLWIYDALALFRNYRLHSRLSRSDIARRVPGLLDHELAGGLYYYDYQTDDARLVLENVLDAAAHGACTLSYCGVEELRYRGGRVEAAVAHDTVTGRRVQVRGRAFVSAAGPWTDEVLALGKRHRRWIRPTKGVHVVLPREALPLEEALVMRHPFDGRVHFMLPFFERVVLGTTDTDYTGDPAEIRATADDVRYLIASANHYFPDRRIVPGDVIATWAGLRPLLDQQSSDDPSDVSREHRIEVRSDGVVVIAGGKLTTYRRMAAECVDRAIEAIREAGGPGPRARCSTAKRSLPGSVGLQDDQALERLIEQLAAATGGDREVGEHLAYSYGARGREVVEMVRRRPELGQRLASDLPFIGAEIAFAARHEMALQLGDALIRRTQVLYRDRDQGLGLAERAAELMGEELGWSDEQRAQQLAAYRQQVAANRAWQVELEREQADEVPPAETARTA